MVLRGGEALVSPKGNEGSQFYFQKAARKETTSNLKSSGVQPDTALPIVKAMENKN